MEAAATDRYSRAVNHERGEEYASEFENKWGGNLLQKHYQNRFKKQTFWTIATI